MLISSIVSILLVFSVHVTGHATVSSNALSGLTLLKRDRIANASSSSTLLQDWYQQRARQQEHVAISLESSSSLFLSGNQEHQQNRRLQADNYRADYVGQFQAFRGPSCTGPSPVIRAYCIGTINVERTSSPSIACTSFVDTEFGLVGVECLTTCTGSACDGIYLNSGMPIQSAPFGEVFFSCSGPNQIDVESSFSWEDTGGDGSCLADPNDPYGFNLHVTRLGVSCESSFVFDDFYADCASSLPLDGNPGDEYACVTGSICDGLACTVDYDGIVMFSQGHNFASECVTSLNGFLISPAPTPGVNEVGTLFTSKFNASWALNVEVDFAPSTSCTTSTAGSRTILIVCGTPGGSIKIIESDSSVQCETITSNSMECSDSSSVVNVFSSVIYECTSNVVPTTSVEFTGTEVSCNNNMAEATVKQSVVLGPFCSILGLGPDFLYSDLYTECGRENQFDTLIVPIPFACSETAAFPAFSTSSTERTIQTVIMSTDLIWSQDPDPTCLTINSNVAPIAPTPAAPVDPPTKASTSRPIDLPTTASPTTSPVSRTSPNTGSGTLPTIKNQPSPPSKPQNVTQPTNTNVQVLPPTNIAPNTTLDDGARFSASYVAQFQYLRNAGCSGPNPFIVVHCLGRIKLTGRSDKRISCIPVAPGSELEFTPYTGLQCSSNCTTDSECEEIFLNTKEVLSGPPFGSIYFQCSGYFSESVSSVFHVYGVEENSTCAASSSDNSTRNIRIARMGVSCLNEAGNAFEYVFDDYYFECLAGTFNSPTFNYPSGEVACISGRNCLGEQCQFLMDDIYVLSDFRNMDDGCIASVNPITPAPVSTNAPGPGVPLEFSVVFKVVWGSLIYDEELDDDIVTSNTDDCIDGTSPVITISCPNSDITLVNATFPGTTECTSNSPGVLDCTDSGETNTNRLISVDYKCSGPILPTTKISYPSTNVYCDGNNATTSVRHALQLGVECEDEDDGIFFFYQDNYFECAGLSAQFDFLDVKGENFTAFTCIQSAQFPVGSKLDDNITIPELSIGTDYIWDIAADDTCYGISKATSAPSTVMPVAITLAPMSSPTTLAPSTLSPVTKPPTKVPTTSPVTSTPTGRPVTEMPVSLAPVEQAPPVAAALNAERSSSLQIFNFLGWASGLNTVAWGIGLGLAMLF